MAQWFPWMARGRLRAGSWRCCVGKLMPLTSELAGRADEALDNRASVSVAAPPLAQVTDGRSTRTRTILLYAQDNRGLGHINRTLIIARHILAAYPTFVAYIATKSPIAGGFTLPERCDYIKLPTRLTPA